MKSALSARRWLAPSAAAIAATLSLLLVYLLLPGPVAAAPGTSLLHQIETQGTSIVGNSGEAPSLNPGELQPPRGSYIWRSTHTGIIGSSTGISITAEGDDVMMGHENYPPTPVEIFAADGDGTPYWTDTASYAQVSARAGTYALADYVEGVGIKLTCWYQDLGVEAWTKDLSGCEPAGFSNTLLVSLDGSRVFYGCYCGGQVRFMAVEAATGTVLVDQIITLDSPSLRNMGASDTGQYVDLNCGVYHVVFDVDAGAERARVNMGASTNPVGISESGQWIASGFSSVKAYQWDPDQNTYIQRLNRTTPNHYCGTVAVSDQGFLLVGWYSINYNHNRFQRWSLIDYGLDWQVDLPTSPGQVQDLPVAVDCTPDRSLFVFGCWGDTYDISPEIVVFDAADGNQVASLHAPGSIFDVAISEDGRYVSGVGKLVHANQMGSGSDAYCMEVTDPTSVDPLSTVGAAGLTAWPNPFTLDTRIAWDLDGTVGASRLTILDAQGRLVRSLRAPGSDSPVLWDGRDESGRVVPAGAYFCLPERASEEALRIVRLR